MSTGSVVVITYTPPGGSPEDITGDCLFATWHFTSQMAANPGQFSGIVRDKDQTHSFITGGEIQLMIDGVIMFGGYVLSAKKQWAFVADNTSTVAPSDVKSRQWELSGSDYNYKLDKLIFHNVAGHLTEYVSVPASPSSPVSDAALIAMYPTYFDVPSDWDLTTHVTPYFYWTTEYYFSDGQNSAGFSMRAALKDFIAQGSVVYMRPDKALFHAGVESQDSPWGFSDVPDGVDFIGFRDGSTTENLTSTANEAFVWGGAALTSSPDTYVFYANRKNDDSIALHGRWQVGEPRVGDLKSQAEVDARANVIISGNTIGTTTEGQQGVSEAEQQYNLSWYAHMVPKIDGVPQHLYPGMLVPLYLWTFSEDGGVTPWMPTQMAGGRIPLRSMEISFPNLDPTGKGYVLFSGTFGILLSDPEWLWAYLRNYLDYFKKNHNIGGSYASAGNTSSGKVPYGTVWNGYPTPDPNGSATVFTIPYGYIGGTTRVYLNGLLQQFGVDYTESDVAGGEITWISTGRSPLITGDGLWIVCRLLG